MSDSPSVVDVEARPALGPGLEGFSSQRAGVSSARGLPSKDGHCLVAFCEPSMNIHLTLTPLISLIAGILILVMPRLLNFIVAIYLILIGLIGLFGGSLHL
jgi:hypothetical protein